MLVNETHLAKSLIFIATGTVDIILLRRYIPALEKLELVCWTRLGYALCEPAVIQFVKERFNKVLDSFLAMTLKHNIYHKEDLTYLFSLLDVEELVEYLVHNEPIVREAAKARFDQLSKVLEI